MAERRGPRVGQASRIEREIREPRWTYGEVGGWVGGWVEEKEVV